MALPARAAPASRPVLVPSTGPDPDGLLAARLLAVDTTDAFVIVTRGDGLVVAFNPALQRLTGLAEAEAVGRPFWDLLPPDDGELLREQFLLLRPEHFPTRYESTWRAADGRVHRIEWHNDAICEGERVLYSVGTGIDVSERQRAQDAVGAIETIGNLLADEGPSAAVLDRTLRILAERFGWRWLSIYLADDGGMRLGAQLGYDDPVERFDGSKGVIGRVFRSHERAFVTDVASDPDYLSVDPSVACEICIPLLQHGEVLGILNVEAAAPLLDERDLTLLQSVADRVAGALALNRKLQQLEVQAFHDALTGLANRALFVDRVEHALARRRRRDEAVAVVFLDLDDFKTVNDGLGHAIGDELLRVVADRLQAAIRQGDTVARLGGDEFGVLFEPVRGPGEAVLVANRLLAAFDAPFAVGQRKLVVRASAGIALADADAAEVLRDADVAMYRAKAAGKGRSVLFEPAMRDAAIARLDLERELRAALEQGDLFLEYQPIVDVATRRVCAVEALVRWRHATRGILPPASFIDVAEEAGLIVQLGRDVLRQACRQASAWLDAGSEAFHVSVNISPRQLADPGLLDDVETALREARLPATSLILEITENVLMQHPDRAVDALGALRRMGVRVAIDDFGTGYSSLSYVKDFPLDLLKIDRSFVGALDERGPVVETLFRLGRVLGLQTVAEGVETEAQMAGVQALGADLAQGYLVARPMPAEAMGRLLLGHGRADV
jgi:diguanylate cyclase (GGDEF)-like protein/PAS domain S-box-containing protein